MTEELARAIINGDSERFTSEYRSSQNTICSINYISSSRKPALNIMLASERLDEDQMIAFSDHLLSLGANPRRGAFCGKDAISLARERGFEKLAEHLQTSYLNYGASYVREARKRDIKDLCLYYAKADGLIFRIADFEWNVFVGGDYDGAYLGRGLDMGDYEPPEFMRERVSWFMPFLERIVGGDEISFDALMKHQDKFAVYHEDRWNNWDYFRGS